MWNVDHSGPTTTIRLGAKTWTVAAVDEHSPKVWRIIAAAMRKYQAEPLIFGAYPWAVQLKAFTDKTVFENEKAQADFYVTIDGFKRRNKIRALRSVTKHLARELGRFEP